MKENTNTKRNKLFGHNASLGNVSTLSRFERPLDPNYGKIDNRTKVKNHRELTSNLGIVTLKTNNGDLVGLNRSIINNLGMKKIRGLLEHSEEYIYPEDIPLDPRSNQEKTIF